MKWVVRGVAIGFLILLVGGIAGGFFAYKRYTALRAQRIAELQKKAEDVKVTLIEGWKISEIGDALEKQGLGKSTDFVVTAKNNIPENDPLIKIPKGQSLEGYLFPDTYRFAKTSTQDMIIKKMLKNFSDRVETLQAEPASNGRYIIKGFENLDIGGQKGLSFHQIITLASIIEKESGAAEPKDGQPSERRIIAGVFYNRLLIDQALESDATVNYVSGKDNPTPTNQELQISSPYNTYRNAGLPPGPICNPSLSSIEAALNPAPSDYYYFLHKQPSGEAVFSKTFEEHVKNKFLYLK